MSLTANETKLAAKLFFETTYWDMSTLLKLVGARVREKRR